MASWKKVALETTAVSFSDLTLTGLSGQGSEATALMINDSNVVGTRELGANAFTSTTIGTTTGALTDGTGIADFTFDGSGAVSISTDDGAINHDNLSNFVPQEHINHTLVEIATASGTSGLSGGGNIASTRNLVVDIAGTTLLDEAAATDDEVLIYDTSGTALKSVTVANLVASAGAVDSAQLTSDSGNTGADVGAVNHTITGLAESGISTSVVGNTLSIDLNISSLSNSLAFDSASAADLILVDDGANGTSKKMTLDQLTDFIETDIALPNAGLVNDSITIGSTEIDLGASQTAIAGLTGLDFTAADASIASSIGSNTLTIGHANSHVKIAGDLQVVGTTETVNSTELLVEDKTVTLANGGHSAANGDHAGIIIDTSSVDANRAEFVWKNAGIGVAGWQFKDDGASASFPDMGVAALTLGAANPSSTIMPVGSLFYNDGTGTGNEGLYLYTTT
jgi:hypothetical protein